MRLELGSGSGLGLELGPEPGPATWLILHAYYFASPETCVSISTTTHLASAPSCARVPPVT